MSTRSRIAAFGSGVLLVAAGGVAAALVSGTVGQVVAFVLIALGFVLITALVFLEVGLSEDRERAKEEERARSAKERAAGRRRPRLERMRGRPRRLR